MLGQVLYWFKTNYPTVTAEKQRVLFGTTVQGGDPVGRFYSNLRRLARLAGIDEQQIRLQFLRGLSPANQMEVRRLGIEKSVNELLPRLEEIERYTAEQLSGAYLHSNSDSVSSSKGRGKDNYSGNTGMTETQVKNLIKSVIESTQSTSSKPQEEQSNQITLSQNDFKKIIAGLKGTIAKGQQTLKKPPGPGKQKADDLAMNRFLDNFDNTGLPGEDYDYDPIEDLRQQFEEMGINQAKLTRAVHVVLKSSQYKCSKCSKPGHNSRNCSKNKKKSKSRRSNKSKSKKKGKVNFATKDSNSESDTSSSDNESNSGSNSESGSESESDSENNFTEDDIVKIINAVNAVKSKKKSKAKE
jgi:hypothetical protein